ncbi:MAG: hypothetical protein J6B00_01640 [Alphaproteobacteria bacterium]|nr:hypothetical protein [Alphaproteobacteria bacterium]MBP3688272.1 hypothetical protein [Alphaproteobacteria bacterium]
MLHFVLVIMLHILPFLLLMIPFLLLFDVSLKRSKKAVSAVVQKTAEPDISELEEKLTKLIENNKINLKINELHEELAQSRTNTVSAYIKLNKKDLKGFHLFQLIFAMIKNNAEDKKIIKVLRHYLPSCATSHLYALLHSFKVFLNISRADGLQKELLTDLNHNRVRTTLLYLEKKLNQTLNRVAAAPPAMQQMLIDQAVVYGLVFAAFAEFYDNEATEKILRLACQLSPELFKYWHIVPKTDDTKTYEYIRRPLKNMPGYAAENNRLN